MTYTLVLKNVFHVWITALTGAYADGIIRALKEKDYRVSPADGVAPTLGSKNFPSTLIALRVEAKDNIEFNVQTLYDDLNMIVKELKAKCYSIVVSEYSSQSIWARCNFTIPNKKEEEIPIKKLN